MSCFFRVDQRFKSFHNGVFFPKLVQRVLPAGAAHRRLSHFLPFQVVLVPFEDVEAGGFGVLVFGSVDEVVSHRSAVVGLRADEGVHIA